MRCEQRPRAAQLVEQPSAVGRRRVRREEEGLDDVRGLRVLGEGGDGAAAEGGEGGGDEGVQGPRVVQHGLREEGAVALFWVAFGFGRLFGVGVGGGGGAGRGRGGEVGGGEGEHFGDELLGGAAVGVRDCLVFGGSALVLDYNVENNEMIILENWNIYMYLCDLSCVDFLLPADVYQSLDNHDLAPL